MHIPTETWSEYLGTVHCMLSNETDRKSSRKAKYICSASLNRHHFAKQEYLALLYASSSLGWDELISYKHKCYSGLIHRRFPDISCNLILTSKKLLIFHHHPKLTSHPLYTYHSESQRSPFSTNPAVEEFDGGLRLVMWHHVPGCMDSHKGQITVTLHFSDLLVVTNFQVL